jgi:hypothetical protein
MDAAVEEVSEELVVSVAMKHCYDDRRGDNCNDDKDGDSNDGDNSDDDKGGDNKHNYVPCKTNVDEEEVADAVLPVDAAELADGVAPEPWQIFPAIYTDK